MVRRAFTILLTTLATVVLIAAFLFIPLSLVTAQYGNIVGELAIVAVTLWYITRVMRHDRRERKAAEALLPPERRPVRRSPRRPITFQLLSWIFTVLPIADSLPNSFSPDLLASMQTFSPMSASVKYRPAMRGDGFISTPWRFTATT